MEDLESITSEVRQCLDNNPRTRDSDNLLYWMIAQDILQKQDIDIDRMGIYRTVSVIEQLRHTKI